MDRAAVRAFCLTMIGAREDFPFGPSVAVFKVGGKVFAILDQDGLPGGLSLKCDPVYGAAMREQYPAVTPGYHLNKRHWNSIRLDGSVPDDLLQDWIRDSHALVVATLPRAQRVAHGLDLARYRQG